MNKSQTENTLVRVEAMNLEAQLEWYRAAMPQIVLEAVLSELRYQEAKWPLHTHTAGEWVLIMDKCMTDAKRAYVTGHGDDSALHEIRQVVAVGIAAMKECGALFRPLSDMEKLGVDDEHNRFVAHTTRSTNPLLEPLKMLIKVIEADALMPPTLSYFAEATKALQLAEEVA